MEDNEVRLVANGPMRTKEEIQDVVRAGVRLVIADLDYLQEENIDGPLYNEIADRISNRLAVMSTRLRLATGYGSEG